MNVYEGPVQTLIDELGRLPGIGPKSAQRIAFYLLKADAVDAKGFEHYLPDMSEVVRFKTASIDDFFAGSIAYLTPDG